jgi:scyllo-inositol 2-dehydrogenase (NAD+)
MAELLGTNGTLRVGYLRETPLMVMTKGQVAHDTVPYFMERFAEAYTAQLENFARNVLQQRPPPITVDDGVEALRVALAATRAQKTGARVEVAAIQTV